MKIPVVEAPRVNDRPLGEQYLNEDHRSPLQQVGKAFGGLADTVGKQVASSYAASQESAAELVTTDAQTRYTHEITTTLDGPEATDVNQLSAAYQTDFEEPAGQPPTAPEGPTGYLSSRGTVALERTEETLEHLEKRRKEIAEKLPTEASRNRFLERSAAMYEEARKRVYAHSRQEVGEARGASAKAAASASLDAVAADYSSDQTMQLQEETIGPVIRAQQLSPEDGDAKLLEWRKQATTARLNRYLSNKDWRGAESLYGDAKETLGASGEQIEKHIQTLKQDAEGEATALKAVEGARNEGTGRVDPLKARKALDKMEPGPEREEAEQRLERRLTAADKNWKSTVDGYYERAFGAYLQGDSLSAIDSGDKAWLQKNAPDEWQKIRRIVAQDEAADRALVDRSERRSSRSIPETEEEADALTALRAEIASDPERFKGMSTGEFLSEHVEGLSKSGRKVAGALFARTKGDAKASPAEFNAYVKQSAAADPILAKNKPAAAQYTNMMGELRRSFVEQHKREPSPKEMAEMRQSVFEEKDSWLKFVGVGPKRVLKQETPAAPASQKKSAAGAPNKLQLVGPGGQVGWAPAAGLDAWLAKHPTWKRK